MLRTFAKYLQPKTLNRQGYTIDQTILIVAIIAILITLIIITIGWQLINRTSGTKAGSQLKQVEDSISQFYAAARVFPHQAFTTAPTSLQTAFVLSGNVPTGLTLLPSIASSTLTNYVGGFRVSGQLLQNSNNGTVAMINGDAAGWTASPAGRQSLIVGFTNVPLSDAEEADRAIDGAVNGNTGRVIFTANPASPNTTAAGCLPAAGGAVTVPTGVPTSPVSLCYVAAPVN